MAMGFRPTELDLALAADPVAEAARLALSVAAGELSPPLSSSEKPRKSEAAQDQNTAPKLLSE
jgi:hypothetical protein